MKHFIVFLLCSCLLTGCWDMKAVQDMNIITALGVDYVKDKFVVYGQLTDFSAVSSSDTGGGKKNDSTSWVGHGTGDNMIMAFNDMYRTAQHNTMWTHVKAIVLTDSALEHLVEIVDALMRARELRYTPWVYGTKQSLEEIFSASTTLNQSPLVMQLFEPIEVFKQNSGVEPIHLQKLINSVREPATVTLLPDLNVNNKHWTVTTDGHPNLMEFVGVYVIKQGKNQGKIKESELTGARMIKFSRMDKYPIQLNDVGQRPLVLYLSQPHSAITLRQQGEQLKFNIELITQANIVDTSWDNPISEQTIIGKTSETLKKEIAKNFEDAKAKGIDLFGLEEYVYRHHYALWKQKKSSGKPLLEQSELDHIKIKVNLNHSNTYKLHFDS